MWLYTLGREELDYELWGPARTLMKKKFLWKQEALVKDIDQQKTRIKSHLWFLAQNFSL